MIMRVWLMVERSWPTKPAECQVVPSVSACCSTSTTSVQPGQVVGHAAAGDAAADHHGRCGVWEHTPVLPSPAAAQKVWRDTSGPAQSVGKPPVTVWKMLVQALDAMDSREHTMAHYRARKGA